MKHYRRSSCRLCDSSQVESLIEYRPTPPAEWFFQPELRDLTKKCFPLELFFCNACYHVQLLDVLDPIELFSGYFYTSESSPGLVKHFELYAKHLVNVLGIPSSSLVLDVGSNDGTFLNALQKIGMRPIGVEPSNWLVTQTRLRGFQVYNDFMSTPCVEKILSEVGKVGVVTANNVFAHNDDLHSMAINIRNLLSDEGIFVFEVSSLLETIRGLVFDYVYHEHLSYHSLTSLIPFLQKVGFEVFRIENIPTKGGSLRVFCQLSKKGKNRIDSSVTQQLLKESEFGIHLKGTYISFWESVQRKKKILLHLLSDLKKQGDIKIVGFGASATTTTLVYEFELIDFLDFIVDDNPIRHGCELPGTGIQIKSPLELEQLENGYVLTLAWRFIESIHKKYGHLEETNGLKFIVPLPRPHIR